MKQRLFRFITFALFTLFTVSIHALDIEASPNANGNIDFTVSHEWRWNSHLYSGLQASITNPLDVQEDSSSYIATAGRGLEGSLDLLGIRFGKDISLGGALNFQYSSSFIKEIGYVDASDGKRYFLVNERNIDLMLPRLKMDLGYSSSLFILHLSGEAAPWFFVCFDQSLYVDDSGARLPTTLSTTSSGFAAASVNANLSIFEKVIAPELQVFVDYVPITYDYLDYTLTKRNLNSMILNYGILGGFTITALKNLGSAPRIMIGYEWQKVRDNSSGSWIVSDGRLKFALALSGIM
jgi:hypothetical protein